MDNKEEMFQYTYCAEEQAEVARIRKKYLPAQEDKLAQLRKLDGSASKKAQAWAIALGTIGTLILGGGMSLFMSDFGELLGPYRNLAMIIGILIGVVGLVLVALAYPVYNRILKKERQRIAPEILRLTDELMK